jgi:E2F/DP family winged-helix DNA-binding domain/E2F transcription factor CC-MB domain
MYAAGSSSSDDIDYSPTATAHPQSSYRRKMRANGILKCFILTPTAQYVNPLFADLFPASSDHDHPSPHRSSNDNAATTTTTTTNALAADSHYGDPSSDAPHNILSPHHSVVSRQRRTQRRDSGHPFAASSPTSSTTLRSPSSTLSSAYSASPPTSLLNHVLVPTPPHSTATGSSTLASSPDSGGRGGLGGCDSTIGSPSMYHSLLHPSPSARSVASSSSLLCLTSTTTPRRSTFDDPAGSSAAASATSQDRGDTSLGALSRRFVSLIQTCPNGSLDLNHAVEWLGVGKRRIYDVTNVLEGIGLIAKVGKTRFEWTGIGIDVSVDLSLLSRVDAVRSQLNDLAEKERQIDQYLAIMYQHSMQYSNASVEGVGAAVRHMYVRYSDVTHLHSFYGSDTIIGIKAPVGTNLEVPDPEQGMEVGKRRYHMYLSSKLPEGSVPLGAKDNRGPIRVYLVRPEAKPGENVAPKPAPPPQQEFERPAPKTNQGPTPASKRGSYVEPDRTSSVKERDATPASNERVSKRPYAEHTNSAARPYATPQVGPHHHPYYYYPDAASAWGHPPPHYYPVYYPPPPPPSTASAEIITPENDAKPPATLPKRKRESLPAGAPSPRRTTGRDDVRLHPLGPFEQPDEPWGRQSVYEPNYPNPATYMAASGSLPPYWQRSIGPEFDVAGSPLRSRNESGIPQQNQEDRLHPNSPLISPAAVDPSELFSMPLQSPLGSRQTSLGAGGSVGAPDRSLLLSPGASAPPGFSPRPMYDSSVTYPHRSVPPDPTHLSFPSLSEATPPRPRTQLGKKTQKAESSAATKSDAPLSYRRRQREYNK